MRGFQAFCGAASFAHPDIEPIIPYVIDNEAPILKIPAFPGQTEECQIGTYELYSDAETPSIYFEQGVVVEGEDSSKEIHFKLLEDYKNIKGEYTYIVRASDITGSEEVMFDPELSFTFAVVCGEKTFAAPDIAATEYFVLDTSAPTLKVP